MKATATVRNGLGRKTSLLLTDTTVFNFIGENAGVKFGNSSETANGDFSVSAYLNGKCVNKFKIKNAA